MMSGTHSILPPSSAKAWRQCAQWVTMNRQYPKSDTPESMEGTAAHWVFEEMLKGQPVIEGQIAANGIVITDEMIDGGELVVDTVKTRIGNHHALHIEERVHIPAIHEQCFGTPDIWSFDQSTMTIELIDYKFGHRFVDEYENDQCIAYISGITELISEWMNHPGLGLLDQALKVNVTIVQPRCFYKGSSVRTWSFVASDIRGHINQLAMAAERALSSNPTATTNSECLDCPGRHVCPALQKAAYSDAEFAVQSLPVHLSPEAASLELKMLERSQERLQSRIDGLTETVKAFIKQGQRVPWQRAEQSYGRTKWTTPIAEVKALGQLFNVDLSKESVVTPNQAVKLGIDEAVIKAYSVTPMGSIKLVPENPADIKRIFGTTK